MMGFLNAEDVLSDLRNGQSILTDKIHYITFDNKKSSQDDLSELKSLCTELGYSFNAVDIFRSPANDQPIFFYLIKILPDSMVKPSREYMLIDEAIG